MKYTYILVSLLILLSGDIWSQQQGLVSQYRQQMSLFNPATVSINESSNLSILHRRQWNNVPSSPISTSLTYGFYAGKNVGLGLSIVTDKVFIEQSTFVGIDYSYKIQLDETASLYLGLKAGANLYSLNTFNLNTYNPYYVDPSLNSVDDLMPNLGIGAYLQKRSFYISVGIPRLLSTERARAANGRVTSVRDIPHIYSSIGYNFLVNKLQNIRIKPSIFTRNVIGAPMSLDVNTMVSFLDRFELGATYRSGGNYAGIVQLGVTESLKIAWTYEVNRQLELSSVGDSLEFLLLYEF
jgi:type IX secretion system PorP/SprF family membrane protein|tara:strand:- start:424 stop:1311 length:888 start_codon:yes stop_codon:yes gene_type:complete